MRILILGSAAGGGFPQWNCGCANCAGVRQKNFPGKARMQAQIAVSSDDLRWFLAGASPDLTRQIEAFPELQPRTSRGSPVVGVVLASADLDHVAGLLLLRELQPLRVYASTSVLHILRAENSMFGMLNRVDPQVVWSSVPSEAAFALQSSDGEDCGLQCEAIFLSGRYPKYVKTEAAKLGSLEASAGLFFESASGKKLAYLPAIPKLTDKFLEKIDGADLLLFDGTFWSDDELIRVQGSGETAHQMGHIPIEESLRLLRDLRVKRKMFIHINNTNPILNESSAEHRAVRQAGWEVAEDNWRLEL